MIDKDKLRNELIRLRLNTTGLSQSFIFIHGLIDKLDKGQFDVKENFHEDSKELKDEKYEKEMP